MLLWDEVAELRVALMRMSMNGIPAGSQQRYRMRSQAGVEIAVTEWLGDIDKLGATIYRELAPRISRRVQSPARAREKLVVLGRFRWVLRVFRSRRSRCRGRGSAVTP